jgi:GH35 family endo-1,4-beta-xylanase
MVTRFGRNAVLSSALLAAVVAGAVAMAAAPTPSASAPASAPAVDQSGPSIKDVYKGHFLIGTAADVPGGFSEQDLQVIKDNFNAITPENCMKPGPTHPTEDRYDFTRADALVDWAIKNNIKIHGHCLAWHSQTTNWMFQDADKETVIKRLQEHVKTVVTHFKGKIMSWDVVNESINDGGNAQTTETENLRASSPYVRTIGPEFLEIAFKAAHEADPDAHLYYNDYNIENGFKHGSSMALLKRLIKNGTPIYGVGIQGHWSTRGAPLAECDKSISDYAGLGLKVSISELDITTTGVQGGQLNPAGGPPDAGGPPTGTAPGFGGRRGGRGTAPATSPATAPGGAMIGPEALFFAAAPTAPAAGGPPGAGAPGAPGTMAGGRGARGGMGGGMGGRGAATPPTPEALKAQAETYAKAFAIFEKHKDVIERVTLWGLNDRRSWRQGSNPLILDANNLRKPCYNSIVNVVLHPDPSLWPN